jgi:hypothetical protein
MEPREVDFNGRCGVAAFNDQDGGDREELVGMEHAALLPIFDPTKACSGWTKAFPTLYLDKKNNAKQTPWTVHLELMNGAARIMSGRRATAAPGRRLRLIDPGHIAYRIPMNMSVLRAVVGSAL